MIDSKRSIEACAQSYGSDNDEALTDLVDYNFDDLSIQLSA